MLSRGIESYGGSEPWAGRDMTVADLIAYLTPPAWHADAACKEHDEIDFFTKPGGTTTAAAAVCAGCLVRDECRDYALCVEAPSLRYGVWGGSTPKERDRHASGADTSAA